MPFTPAPPFPKSSGDSIRSTDWNALVNELIRLDNAKAERAGDTFAGPVTVNGALRLAGGQWDVTNTEGDFRIGNDTLRLKVGVALAGGGAGDVRIRAMGGTNRLMLGAGASDSIAVFGDNVGVGTITPGSKLDVAGFTRSLGLSVNDGSNTGVGRGVWLWMPTNTDHVIYSANQAGRSPANTTPAAPFFNAVQRLRIRTAAGQGFLFENNADQALVDIDSSNGNLWTRGAMFSGDSAMYFTNTAHNHTGFGNTAGFAALENSSNFNTLMILGRSVSTNPLRRVVDVWDQLTVHSLACSVKIGVPSTVAGSYAGDGVRGEPNLWLDAAGTVLIKQGFQSRGMDIAERFPAHEKPEAGDVMVFDESDRHIQRCNRVADKRAVGIVSKESAFILGIEQTEVPIALCGRVSCKADADIAPIEAGDLLTTSPTSGHAQKALDPNACAGAIIGKALTSLASGRGEVLALVHVG